jgi:hypothetical protein
MVKYRIYDNGGETFDRYTLVTKNLDLSHENDYYGFSENPFHPQGFGQSCGNHPMERSYKHLGKLITIKDLPDQARKYVRQIIKDYEEV